jgi:Zn-dependent M16 (insulinase) family peptidase
MATPAEIADERRRLKEVISQAIKRVPQNVIDGGVLAAREFKAWHASATKKLASDKTSTEDLRALRRAVDNLYNPRVAA